MNIESNQKLMGIGEREEFSLSSFTTPNEQLRYLLVHRILLMVDWKGEEQEYLIGNFLKERKSVLKPQAVLNVTPVYEKMQKEISKGNLLSGDAVPFLLKQFQNQLKPAGLVIVLLERDNDSYYIGLSRQEDSKQLCKDSGDFWKYSAFGSKTGQVLYTVTCSCGSMNVWQLKPGELLVDDYCQDCGKELFDKEGNASMPVIKEFI